MSTITLDEFREKYCKMCGTQLCGGVTDEDFRDGCAHYRREILKQPTIQDILTSVSAVSQHPKYNPVEQAYEILYKVFVDKYADETAMCIAIEEAIGFLGDALAD